MGSSSSRSRRKRRRSRSRRFRRSAEDGSEKRDDKGAADGVASSQATADPPEIAQAKKQVLAKLTTMKNIEPKEDRAKEFRQLLREWHPDKNPDRIDMATAVFQFLQKGK